MITPYHIRVTKEALGNLDVIPINASVIGNISASPDFNRYMKLSEFVDCNLDEIYHDKDTCEVVFNQIEDKLRNEELSNYQIFKYLGYYSHFYIDYLCPVHDYEKYTSIPYHKEYERVAYHTIPNDKYDSDLIKLTSKYYNLLEIPQVKQAISYPITLRDKIRFTKEYLQDKIGVI